MSHRFKMHDTNEDSYWDLKEAEAMMWDDATKLHETIAKSKGGEVDKFAVKEEMARMRDHLMSSMDTNGDMLVSFEEFIGWSEKKDFEKEKAWKPVNPEKEMEDEKLALFDKHRKANKKSKHKNLPPDMIDIAKNKMAQRELLFPSVHPRPLKPWPSPPFLRCAAIPCRAPEHDGSMRDTL